MMKLLIVDDERVPREGMVTLIPWADYGIQVMDTAADGLDALAKIERETPDIVLTDIKMPQMDGIELLKTLHRERPEIDSLIISGYDEFEYAQKAINYGAKGYILKPLDPTELLNAVLSIVQQRKCGAAGQDPKSDVDTYLRNLIYACYTPEQLEEATDSFAAIRGYWFRIIIMQLENIRDALQEQPGSLYRSLMACVEQYRQENEALHIVEKSPNHMIFVLADPEKQAVTDQTKTLLETMVAQMQQARYTEFVIGVSGYCATIDQLAEKYLGTLRIVNMKYIYGSGRAYYVGKDYALSGLESKPASMTKQLVEATFRHELDAVDQLMTERYRAFHKDKTCLSDVQQFARNLLHALVEQAGEMDLNMEDVYRDSKSIIFSICTSNSRREIMARLTEFMKAVSRYMQQYRGGSAEQVCRNVKDYIRTHYDNPGMSTRTIAEAFHFNPNYLSSVFSVTCHTTVTNFINAIRMEQACVFLKASDMKINQIAERVGFVHPTYFCTVFKREIGVSPTDYRTVKRA